MCSITATVYYGGLCTQKYISDPVTVSTDIVPLETLPPLKWSFCKEVYLTDCTKTKYLDWDTFDYVESGLYKSLVFEKKYSVKGSYSGAIKKDI